MQRPRATRDLFGRELRLIRRVQRGLEAAFKRYGYEEVDTPIFEPLELFTRKSGDEIVKQIYKFEDKSGRELALRPELTAPVVRLFNNRLKSEPKPLKVFYSGPCFRYERKQAGRWRQFLQAGVELMGSDRPEADAEIVAITEDSANELGLEDYDLRLGHIGLIRLLLTQGGVTEDAQDPILRAIDGGDESEIEEKLDKSGFEGKQREWLNQLIRAKGGAEVLEKAEGLLTEVSGVGKLLQNFNEILKCLEHFGVNNYSLDLGIARGLEYYTGFVFELYADGLQLGGGGRYDRLVEVLGGEPCPAVGVGFGIDRIAQVLENQGLELEEESLDCMVFPTEDSMLGESLNLAKELRRNGLITDVDLMGRKLSKALGYADSRGVKFAIIVGPKDMAQGKVTLRDMETGDQSKVAQKRLVKKLRTV